MKFKNIKAEYFINTYLADYDDLEYFYIQYQIIVNNSIFENLTI